MNGLFFFFILVVGAIYLIKNFAKFFGNTDNYSDSYNRRPYGGTWNTGGSPAGRRLNPYDTYNGENTERENPEQEDYEEEDVGEEEDDEKYEGEDHWKEGGVGEYQGDDAGEFYSVETEEEDEKAGEKEVSGIEAGKAQIENPVTDKSKAPAVAAAFTSTSGTPDVWNDWGSVQIDTEVRVDAQMPASPAEPKGRN